MNNPHVCATAIDLAGREYEPHCDECWDAALAVWSAEDEEETEPDSRTVPGSQ